MAPIFRTSFLLATSMLVFSGVADAGKKKKKQKKGAEAPVGWHQEEGWLHDCYFPPDLAAMEGRSQKDATIAGVDELLTQWRGERSDGIEFEANVIDEVEVIILSQPSKGVSLLGENLEQCKKSASGQGSAAWHAWLRGSPAALTAGECLQPLDYTVFNWLEVGMTWQEPRMVCGGDRVKIVASAKDRFRVSESGPWINVDGDPDRPTVGMDGYPCKLDGCFEGMLVLRYVTESGTELIFPAGSHFVYDVPENGTISYMINDATFYDNIWYQSGGLMDKASIEISPAE